MANGDQERKRRATLRADEISSLQRQADRAVEQGLDPTDYLAGVERARARRDDGRDGISQDEAKRRVRSSSLRDEAPPPEEEAPSRHIVEQRDPAAYGLRSPRTSPVSPQRPINTPTLRIPRPGGDRPRIPAPGEDRAPIPAIVQREKLRQGRGAPPEVGGITAADVNLRAPVDFHEREVEANRMPVGAFRQGLRAGALNFSASLPGMSALARGIVGDEQGAVEAAERAQRLQEVAGEVGPRANLESTMAGETGVREYLAGVLGTQVPVLASIIGSSLVTGGAGALVTRGAQTAARQAARGVVADKTRDLAARKTVLDELRKRKAPALDRQRVGGQIGVATQRVNAAQRKYDEVLLQGKRMTAKGQQIGGIVGATAAGTTLYSGEGSQFLIDPEAEGSIRERALVGFTGASLAGIASMLPAVAVLRNIGFGATAAHLTKEAVQKASSRTALVARGTAKQTAIEAPAEMTAEFAMVNAHAFVNENIDVFSNENLMRFLEAGVAGGLVGGMLGGATSFRFRKPGPTESEILRNAVEKELIKRGFETVDRESRRTVAEIEDRWEAATTLVTANAALEANPELLEQLGQMDETQQGETLADIGALIRMVLDPEIRTTLEIPDAQTGSTTDALNFARAQLQDYFGDSLADALEVGLEALIRTERFKVEMLESSPESSQEISDAVQRHQERIQYLEDLQRVGEQEQSTLDQDALAEEQMDQEMREDSPQLAEERMRDEGEVEQSEGALLDEVNARDVIVRDIGERVGSTSRSTGARSARFGELFVSSRARSQREFVKTERGRKAKQEKEQQGKVDASERVVHSLNKENATKEVRDRMKKAVADQQRRTGKELTPRETMSIEQRVMEEAGVPLTARTEEAGTAFVRTLQDQLRGETTDTAATSKEIQREIIAEAKRVSETVKNDKNKLAKDANYEQALEFLNQFDTVVQSKLPPEVSPKDTLNFTERELKVKPAPRKGRKDEGEQRTIIEEPGAEGAAEGQLMVKVPGRKTSVALNLPSLVRSTLGKIDKAGRESSAETREVTAARIEAEGVSSEGVSMHNLYRALTSGLYELLINNDVTISDARLKIQEDQLEGTPEAVRKLLGNIPTDTVAFYTKNGPITVGELALGRFGEQALERDILTGDPNARLKHAREMLERFERLNNKPAIKSMKENVIPRLERQAKQRERRAKLRQGQRTTKLLKDIRDIERRIQRVARNKDPLSQETFIEEGRKLRDAIAEVEALAETFPEKSEARKHLNKRLEQMRKTVEEMRKVFRSDKPAKSAQPAKGKQPTAETQVAPKLPRKTRFAEKDQQKANLAANMAKRAGGAALFIGRGSSNSSTAAYAKTYGDRANSGQYGPNDVVFVSAEGARSNRKGVDTAELAKAADAGATFVTDNAQNRNRQYNVGEREVASFLESRGYTESRPGVWTAAAEAQAAPKQAALNKGKVERGDTITFPPSIMESGTKVAKVSAVREFGGFQFAFYRDPRSPSRWAVIHVESGRPIVPPKSDDSSTRKALIDSTMKYLARQQKERGAEQFTKFINEAIQESRESFENYKLPTITKGEAAPKQAAEAQAAPPVEALKPIQLTQAMRDAMNLGELISEVKRLEAQQKAAKKKTSKKKSPKKKTPKKKASKKTTNTQRQIKELQTRIKEARNLRNDDKLREQLNERRKMLTLFERAVNMNRQLEQEAKDEARVRTQSEVHRAAAIMRDSEFMNENREDFMGENKLDNPSATEKPLANNMPPWADPAMPIDPPHWKQLRSEGEMLTEWAQQLSLPINVRVIDWAEAIEIFGLSNAEMAALNGRVRIKTNRATGESEALVWVNEDFGASSAARRETLMHEFGHAVMENLGFTASESEIKALVKDFRKWVNQNREDSKAAEKLTDKSVRKLVSERDQSNLTANERAVVEDFHEWFADRVGEAVSGAATLAQKKRATGDTEMGALRRFFQRTVDDLKTLFRIESARFTEDGKPKKPGTRNINALLTRLWGEAQVRQGARGFNMWTRLSKTSDVLNGKLDVPLANALRIAREDTGLGDGADVQRNSRIVVESAAISSTMPFSIQGYVAARTLIISKLTTDERRILGNAFQSIAVQRQIVKIIDDAGIRLDEFMGNSYDMVALGYLLWQTGDLNLQPAPSRVFRGVSTLAHKLVGQIKQADQAEQIMQALADDVIATRHSQLEMRSKKGSHLNKGEYAITGDEIPILVNALDQAGKDPTWEQVADILKKTDEIGKRYPSAAINMMAKDLVNKVYSQEMVAALSRKNEFTINPDEQFAVNKINGNAKLQRTSRAVLAAMTNVMGPPFRMIFGEAMRARLAKIPPIRQFMELIMTDVTTRGSAEGMINRRIRRMSEFHGQFLAVTETLTDAQQVEFRDVVHGRKKVSEASKEVQQARMKLRPFMVKARKYAQEAGLDIGDKGPDYFPWVFDTEKLAHKVDALVADWMKPEFKKDWDKLAQEAGYIKKGDEMTDAEREKFLLAYVNKIATESMGLADGGIKYNEAGVPTPYVDSINTRKLDFLQTKGDEESKALLASLFQDDINTTLASYIDQMVKRVEFVRTFGKNGEKFNRMKSQARQFGATDKEIELMQNTLSSAMGTVGLEVSPFWKAIFQPINEMFLSTPVVNEDGTPFETIEAARRALSALRVGGTVEATEGGYHIKRDITENPRKFRQLQAAIVLYQNFRTLIFAAMTNVADIAGIYVRTGSANIALQAYWEGLKEVGNRIRNRRLSPKERRARRSELMRLAEDLGAIEHSIISDVLGQFYGGHFMDGWTRRWSNKFFRWNGMEFLTRTTRMMAVAAARHYVTNHARRAAQGDAKSIEALAQIDLKADDIRVGEDGRVKLLSQSELETLLDGTGLTASGARDAALSDQGFERLRQHGTEKQIENARRIREAARDDRVRQAMFRMVDESVLRPAATQRPTWMNDPNWQIFSHLKGFMYTYQERVLRRAYTQASQGNYGPAMMLPSYVALIMGMDLLREMLQYSLDGDDRKADWTFSDRVWDGAHRSGVGGISNYIPDMMKTASFGRNPLVELGGPAVSQLNQIQRALTGAGDPGVAFKRSLPASQVVGDAIPSWAEYFFDVRIGGNDDEATRRSLSNIIDLPVVRPQVRDAARKRLDDLM